MRECWLRSNPRALAFLLPLPVLTSLLGLGGLVWAASTDAAGPWWWGAGAAALAGFAAVAWLLIWSRRPRLAYEAGFLLVYLRGWSPERVPVEVVESFFRGHGPTLLREPAADQGRTKTTTVVARLAESRADWHHRPVLAPLGDWNDGYIVFRGTWCEPITIDLLRALNKQLAQAHRAQRELAKETA